MKTLSGSSSRKKRLQKIHQEREILFQDVDEQLLEWLKKEENLKFRLGKSS